MALVSLFHQADVNCNINEEYWDVARDSMSGNGLLHKTCVLACENHFNEDGDDGDDADI